MPPGKTEVTIVPFTEFEWNIVKNNLTTDNIPVLQDVLEVLNMWEFRSDPLTPIVIRLTKLVVNGILFDMSNQDSNHNMSYNKQMIYSTVMIRFVNYLNEICQSEDGPLTSVVAATSKIGIPPWIVQMRHSVAHADLPTLNELRNGVLFCRNWLWEMHWKQPVEIALTVPGADPPTQKKVSDPLLVNELKRLVTDYCNVMTSKSKDAAEKKANEKKLQSAMEGFRNVIKEEPHLFIAGITKKFVLSKQNMEKSKFPYNCSETENRVWEIPTALVTFWQQLIVLLEDCNCYGMLLTKVTQLCSDSDLSFFEKSQYAGWSALLLERVFVSEISLSDYDLKSLIGNILEGLYFFSKNVFIKLLELGERISPEKRKEYINLWEIKANPMEIDEVRGNDDEILSLDSLIKKSEAKPQKRYEEWDPVEVKSSLGLTERQSAETLNLKL
ncbi:unnamed protein product [Bursaphelenchus xylophilus]|nr:unnamed protein product [Bursaphelenchus xylophilus]CAG9130615.1 unnamed protein product [Bursaphelenchus xylophilus]